VERQGGRGKKGYSNFGWPVGSVQQSKRIRERSHHGKRHIIRVRKCLTPLGGGLDRDILVKERLLKVKKEKNFEEGSLRGKGGELEPSICTRKGRRESAYGERGFRKGEKEGGNGFFFWGRDHLLLR